MRRSFHADVGLFWSRLKYEVVYHRRFPTHAEARPKRRASVGIKRVNAAAYFARRGGSCHEPKASQT